MSQAFEGDFKRVRDDNPPSSSSGESSKSGILSEDIPYSFVNTQHPSTVLRGIQSLRLSETFCDVNLKGCEEPAEALPCHRLVLSSCSSYFRAMFMSKLDESRQEEVQLHNITSCTLKE